MRKKRISGLLCGLLVLTAVCGGCRQAPSPSEVSLPAEDTTPATSTTTTSTTTITTTTTTTAKPTTTSTTVRVSDTTGCYSIPTTTITTTTKTETRRTTDCFRPWIDFETLADYRQALLTFTNPDRIEQALIDSPTSIYTKFNAERYTMLTEERYFLIPVLPAGYTVSKTTFSGYGYSQFRIETPAGSSVYVSCYHYPKEGISTQLPASTTGNGKRVHSIITNNRNQRLLKEHEVGYRTDPYTEFYQDRYTWMEDGYPFSASCTYGKDAVPEHEKFVKQLTFEKINLK